MYKSKTKPITELAKHFLQPSSAVHRQYEALRAYFVEGVPSAEAARRFGYTPGSFRVLCHQFRRNPNRPFFLAPGKAPPPAAKKPKLLQKIIALRKQNLSIYDIAEVLGAEGHPISPAMVGIHLKAEGFAKLPRRRDHERPPRVRPDVAPIADVRQLDLSPRRFRTQFGGLFLFLPSLAQTPFDSMMDRAGLPGSQMIPAGHAMRSLLALKLFGNARHSHIMSHVFDPGLGLFAGLNVIPKRSFLSEYSCRIDPACYPTLMRPSTNWGSAAACPSTWTSTPFPLTAKTRCWRSTTSPSAADVRRASWPSWPRMRANACFVTPMQSSASMSRTMRSCDSLSSGAPGRDTCRRNWSSTLG
jgi:hypothetical protein